MELDDVVEWDGSEVQAPKGCAFVRYDGDRLTFLPGDIPKSEMNEVDIYHVARVWSVRENGNGFEGYWLKMGWEEIKLADPRRTYFTDGQCFGF